MGWAQSWNVMATVLARRESLNEGLDLIHLVPTVRHRRALRSYCHLPNIRARAHANAHTAPTINLGGCPGRIPGRLHTDSRVFSHY